MDLLKAHFTCEYHSKSKKKTKYMKIITTKSLISYKRKKYLVKVTNEKVNVKSGVFFISPEQEKQIITTSGDIPINKKKKLLSTIRSNIFARKNQEFITTKKKNINFISTISTQIISIGTALIPFLEHNDANRALMGSNMQRQAVPLMKKEKAIVQTGLEKQIAQSSDSTIIAKKSGLIKFKSNNKIVVEERNKNKMEKSRNIHLLEKTIKHIKFKKEKKETSSKNRTYKLERIKKSNQNTILLQAPNVSENQWIKKGQIIADGTGTYNGEICLGKNLLIGYIGWEGYNFEDAVVINKRLIEEDILTSIHIKKYKTFLINDNIGEVRVKTYYFRNEILQIKTNKYF